MRENEITATARAIAKTEAEKIVKKRNPEAYTYTTDSTPQNVGGIATSENTVGVFSVTLAAALNLGGVAVAGITGSKIVRYKNSGGTVTLGTITDVLPTETDTELTGALFEIVVDGYEVVVQVTGLDDSTIYWQINYSDVQAWSVNQNMIEALP